eukprot:1148247-Pelagomonas_calceolata.AAC.4
MRQELRGPECSACPGISMSWVPRSQSELAYIGGSTKLPVVSMKEGKTTQSFLSKSGRMHYGKVWSDQRGGMYLCAGGVKIFLALSRFLCDCVEVAWNMHAPPTVGLGTRP